MTKIRWLILFGPLLLVPSCRYLEPDPNSYSGIIDLDISFNDVGKMAHFRLRDGKERGAVSWSMENTPEGAVLYVGHEAIAAFEGQASRAEIEKTLIEHGITPSSQLLDIIQSLTAIGP